jgi:hypothetical protein
MGSLTLMQVSHGLFAILTTLHGAVLYTVFFFSFLGIIPPVQTTYQITGDSPDPLKSNTLAQLIHL